MATDLKIIQQKLEKKYRTEDPWGYQTNPEDFKRKALILSALESLGIKFEKALDIGCGEGWITKDLPAEKIYGFDLSKTAMSRLPENIIRLNRIKGKYDLVIVTGVLYKGYNCAWIFKQIKRTSAHILLICNIKHREKHIFKNPIYETLFKYRQYTERLAIYDLSSAQYRGEKEESKL